MVKPSWKSGEGISAYGILGVCVYFVYSILHNGSTSQLGLEQAVQHATTAQEIATAYKSELNEGVELLKSGELVALLVFMFKMYSKITDSRTEIKKGEQK